MSRPQKHVYTERVVLDEYNCVRNICPHLFKGIGCVLPYYINMVIYLLLSGIFKIKFNFFIDVDCHYMCIGTWRNGYSVALCRCRCMSMKRSTLWDRAGNVYDKCNAPKWLHDCMPSVELRWHTNKQIQ